MTIEEIKRIGLCLFKKNKIENALFEVCYLICKALKIDKAEYLKNNLLVKPYESQKCLRYFKRRIKNEPLEYITKKCEFMSLEFKVSKQTLIPRQDTETLCEFVIEKFKNDSCTIMDIGTGSGCIAASLAYYIKSSFVYALDVSEKALRVARYNFKNLGLKNKVKTIKHDILTGFPKINKKIDVFVSNPPYIARKKIKTLEKQIKNFEPNLALDGGSDGLLFYKDIIFAIDFDYNFTIVFEVGFKQASFVANLMKQKFTNISIKKDLSGIDRIVSGEYHNSKHL